MLFWQAGDDNNIARLSTKDWFGHEEILSNSRRAFTASALKGETFCIWVPLDEYKRVSEAYLVHECTRGSGAYVLHTLCVGHEYTRVSGAYILHTFCMSVQAYVGHELTRGSGA